MDSGFEEIWERVKKVTGWQTQSDLANGLGIKQGSVSGSKQRGAFPLEWSVKIAQEFKVSTDWLLTGKEPIKIPAPDAIFLDEQLLTEILMAIDDFFDELHETDLVWEWPKGFKQNWIMALYGDFYRLKEEGRPVENIKEEIYKRLGRIMYGKSR